MATKNSIIIKENSDLDKFYSLYNRVGVVPILKLASDMQQKPLVDNAIYSIILSTRTTANIGGYNGCITAILFDENQNFIAQNIFNGE